MVLSSLSDFDRNAPGPLYLRLKEEILRRIRMGALRPGDRLPPTRQLATELRVNRGTVSAAYEELVGDGVLESHVGRGTFVTEDLTLDLLTSGHEPGRYRWADHFAGMEPPPANRVPDVPADLDPVAFHRNIPDETLFPTEAFRRALNAVLRDEGHPLLSYGPSGGHPGFGRFLLEYLTAERLPAISPDEVLVVNGSQQALDLICRALLRPGDTVLVEEPSYSGAIELFNGFGVRLVGVPMDEGGMRLEEAETLLARERPKFIYTMPTFQNPTGHSLAPDRREALVRLAGRYEVPVVEDDFDGELYYDAPPPPPLKGVPGNDGVIYIGTPSKMLFPGLRIGWIVAAPPVVERLGRIKQVADLSSSPLLQAAFARFAGTGALGRHTGQVRAAYRDRRDVLLASLAEHMPAGVTWTRPGGGMSLLVTLPEGVDSDILQTAAAADGVLFSPGRWFFLNDGARHLRLCFGSVATTDIDRGVRALARAVRQELKRDRAHARRESESALPQV